jgi:hypothetical protein
VSKPRQGRVNGTAEKLASVVRGSCRIATRSAVSVQALNARLTQNFFNAAATNLHVSLQDNRQVTQRLIAQRPRVLRATQLLAQETTAVYANCLNPASVYQQSSQRTERSAGARVQQGSAPNQAKEDNLSLDNYDSLKAGEDYEANNKKRQNILERLARAGVVTL